MHARHLSRLATTTAFAAITTIAVGAGGALADAAPSSRVTATSTHRSVAVSAHFTAPPDIVTFAEPCSATNPVPTVGVCRGTSFGSANYTGAVQGSSAYQTAFTISTSAVTYFVARETFSGTVARCGTGTMTMRSTGTIDATGLMTYHWEVVQGLGSGQLVGVTGQGTATGTYNVTQSGDLTGRLRCNRSR